MTGRCLVLLLMSGLVLVSARPARAEVQTFKLDLEAQVGKAHRLRESIVMREGEMRSIFFDGGAVTLLSSEGENGELKIQAEILKKTDLGYQLIDKPVLSTLLNTSAELSQPADDGSTAFSLRVTPRKM